MKKEPAQRLLAVVVLLSIAYAATSRADPPPQDRPVQPPTAGATGNPQSNAPSSPAQADQTKPSKDTTAQQSKPGSIKGLLNSSGKPGPVGLNEQLFVQVAAAPPATAIETLDASKYALFLNGREVPGLPDPIYDKAHQSLVFQLVRNDKNTDLWTLLLGSPSLTEFTTPVTVSLGERLTDGKSAPQSTFEGSKGTDTLNLKVLPPVRLLVATALIAAVIWLVFARAGKSTTLRDNLLPQIEPSKQTYSLGRWQMAFWFTLIFCSFVFLYLLTWDYNSISSQALMLMGISGGTALAAIAVDVAKDSPADAVNRGLRALGLKSYDDVLRVEQEIVDRKDALAAAQKQLAALPPLPRRPALPNAQWAVLNQSILQSQIEIVGRQGILRTYQDNIRPFLTNGWFNDLTTDLNGTAVHRLQVFCWTLVLGVVFLIGVYRGLAMPEFSGTLLALMTISSAGYVGFKYPEKNN